MNSKKVILKLVEKEVKAVENIRFHIQRKVEKRIYLKRYSFYRCREKPPLPRKSTSIRFERFQQLST